MPRFEAAVSRSLQLAARAPLPLSTKLPPHQTPAFDARRLQLLGPSLDDLWQSKSRRPVSGQTLLRVGRGAIRALRQLHLAGFVHNDIKPANLLLGAGSSTLQPTRLHLIDFGSCTRVQGHATAPGACDGERGDAHESLPPLAAGPIGTAMFASVAADEGGVTRPSDDIESLVYTLTYLAAGRLPWMGTSDDEAVAMKRDLLISDGDAAAADLCHIDDIHCTTAVTALQALSAELRRYHEEGGDEAAVDYEACLAALGGGGALDDAAEEAEELLSEFAFMAALGAEEPVEAEAAGVRS